MSLRLFVFWITMLGLAGAGLVLQGESESTGAGPNTFVNTAYHLTARPWKPLGIERQRYLDTIEGVCRFSIKYQDAAGAIIDPILKREHQYATPYFANAVGTLVSAGRAEDLLPYGIKAMEHATQCFGAGRIPDDHGNFFIAALTGALPLYVGRVPDQTMTTWRERMSVPLAKVMRGGTNNWETYVMKGEWMRVLAKLADRAQATATIEDAWTARQRQRIAPAPWFLYHDRSSDPDSLSVEAVGRGNLLALIELGYDGPSRDAIRRAAEAGTEVSLYLQDPSGQVPTNGRTDDHVWVDTGYQLGYEVMAERAAKRGDTWLAGQFRHAAMLAFQSIQRWKRTDGQWAGSYSITKNHFDPNLRVGYQFASQYSNYSGSLMFHMSEAWHAHAHDIEEHPAPAEIGGYAFATDPEFASAFANAGGLQMQANLRGQLQASSGNHWTPLGVVRFARPGWDTRLGPSDGALTADGGVTFAPTFLERGRWLRLADLSKRYEGSFSVQFVHPLLVRCAIEYRPRPGHSGPSFRDEFTLTPEAALSIVTKTSGATEDWGMTLPLLENDGAPLAASLNGNIASVRYPGGVDEQNFISLNRRSVLVREKSLRGSYGDLLPVRATGEGVSRQVLIYPRAAGDVEAAAVAKSFRPTADGFESVLGRVSGNVYVGRTAAGGFGTEIDLDGDGVADASFSQPCGFMLQLRSGKVVSVEADRRVRARIQGKEAALDRYTPLPMNVR